MKVAKIWVNHVSMTTDPSVHAAYLTRPGHQQNAHEEAQVWTKSLPKSCKVDRAALVAHWRGIFLKFIEERQTHGGSVHHNAKVTGRQFVINLPNDITDAQVEKLAKAVLLDFPRHIPVSMVLHRTSNRGKKHMHLQGLFSYRQGGYGAIQEDFRLNVTGQMKTTVAEELTRQGYHVDHGKPGTSINGKERGWLNAQGSVEQRRNPRFMKEIAAKANSPRLKAYCAKQADKMSGRIHSPLPIDSTLHLMHSLTELPSIYPKGATHPPQGQPSTDHPRGTNEPLTRELLEKAFTKARRWQPMKKISRNI